MFFIFQLLLGLLAACVLTLPYMTSNFKHSSDLSNLAHVASQQTDVNADESVIMSNYEHLEWQQFAALCGPTAWERHMNKISTQLRCTHFDGFAVVWEGTVSEVKISRVYNNVADFINKYIPLWLQNTLICLIGEKVQLACQADADVDKIQCAEAAQQLKNKCSLQKWNSYEYELRLHIATGTLLSKPTEVVLQANDKFGNFSRRLVAGDHLKFAGTLLNTRYYTDGKSENFLLGSGLRTHIQLTAVECKYCRHMNKEAVSIKRYINSKSLVEARLRDLKRGFKYLLNVLFNPLITFK